MIYRINVLCAHVSHTNALFVVVQLTINQLERYHVAFIRQSTKLMTPCDQQITMISVYWNNYTQLFWWTRTCTDNGCQ